MLTVNQLKIDSPDIVKISRALADEDWDGKAYDAELAEKLLKEFVSDTMNIYLVAKIDGSICGRSFGYVLKHPNGSKDLFIDEVDTLDQYRRRGVATAMVEKMIKIAGSLGIEEVWVEAEKDNLAANKTYQKLCPTEIVKAINYSYKIKQ